MAKHPPAGSKRRRKSAGPRKTPPATGTVRARRKTKKK